MEKLHCVEVEWGSRRTPLRFHRYPENAPHGYEAEIIAVAERFLEPGDCAIDAGACIGFHSCLFAKLVGPTGLVLAFEPQMESFQYLVRHVHVTNELGNVGCLRMALWKHHEPRLRLHSIDELGYSSFHRYENFTYSEEVEGEALDALLGTANHPRLIKIDCEGTEAEVLLGAQDILRRGVDAVILELNYYLMGQVGRDDLTIRKFMAELGYDMFIISMNDGNGGYAPPVLVPPDLGIQIRGGKHINVLFSTLEKVRARWTTVKHADEYSPKSPVQ